MRLNRRGRRNEMVATGVTGRPGANVPRMWQLEAEAQYGTSADVPYIATREALQNARDAIDQAYWNRQLGRKDGRFAAIVDPGPDGPIPGGYNAIRWTDNGIGMDSETFFGKFMVLGDTTKGGEGAGGFGVAKAIILGGSKTFRWRMWTRDRIYIAEGFDAPIREYVAPSYRQGVSLTVYDLDSENRWRWTNTGSSKVEWDERLQNFLATNDLRPQPRTGWEGVRGRRKEHAGIRMFIGRGSHPLQEVAPRLRGKGIPLIEKEKVDPDGVWLSVHAYKRPVREGSGTYAVRLEGLTQYERPMSSVTRLDLNVDLATTIAPGKPGYPLDKSRNALGDYTPAKRAVDDLLEKLRERAQDRKAGDSGEPMDKYEDAGGTLDTQIRVAAAVEAQYATLLSDEDFKARMALAQGGRALLHRWSAKYDEVYARLLRLRRERELERQREERQRRPVDFYGDVPDIEPGPKKPRRRPRRRVGLEGLDAAQGERKKRVQKPLWPVNPFAPILSVKISRESYNRRRLKRFENNPAKWLRLGVVWRFACEMVLDELGTDDDFKVGFVFDADLRAGFSAEDGVYTLWLNPAWFETVIRAYRDRPMNVAAVLHSKACHEIAHMINRDTEGEYSHGRSFAMERETIADETVGVLYPLSVLAAQMLNLKQAPLKRRKRRGKGNVVDPELRAFRAQLRGACGCATCAGCMR